MHVLLIEPSRIGTAIICDILTRAGHKVECETDGAHAYQRLVANPDIDAVITSFETAGMGGLELCWHARILSDADRPLYILAMSSSREIDKAVEALDCGADDFLRKPPIPHELLAKLRAADRVNKMQLRLIELATRDALSGLLNRRAFYDAAAHVMTNRDKPVGIIMVDIDKFKSINDHFGHVMGDEAIRLVSTIIDMPSAIVARLGGEEFVILKAGTTLAHTQELAEHLRQSIAAESVSMDGQTTGITASFGVSFLSPEKPGNLSLLLKCADEALYAAKNGGRNRVETLLPSAELAKSARAS